MRENDDTEIYIPLSPRKRGSLVRVYAPDDEETLLFEGYTHILKLTRTMDKPSHVLLSAYDHSYWSEILGPDVSE